MPNEIPISGQGTAGLLLPAEQGGMLTNGILQQNGALQVFGDAKTTDKRKASFTVWLGKPTAGPVGEGARKPVTGAAFGTADMQVKKFASIVLFTDEQIEDVQDGDMNVLVDSGVRSALADSIDAHAIGKENGVNLTSVFTTALRQTAAAPIEVDLSKADGVQRAVSEGMARLEDNGYGDEGDMAALLGHGFQRLFRDAREGADTNPLYQATQDPLYGLQRSFSTNLNRVSQAASATNIIGFLVHKPNLHLRLRTDVRVSVNQSATIELPAALPDGRTSVNLFQDNMTAVRYELRLGTFVHDLDRAVIPLVNRA